MPQVPNAAPVQNGSVFNSEGPGPSTGPSAVIQGNDNPPNGSAAGAIQAIAADPSRPDTIYAGAVNGGNWKTTNGGTNWTPLIDQKASLSIASLALDPTDPTRQTLIAGTGVRSNGAFASSSLFGKPATFEGRQNGLLYSRNGGTTWTRLDETTLSGQSVVDVAVRGSTILAATFEQRISALMMTFTGGLYRSINSGATLTASTRSWSADSTTRTMPAIRSRSPTAMPMAIFPLAPFRIGPAERDDLRALL